LKNKVEISETNLQVILGADYEKFRKTILKNVHCKNCNTPYSSTITSYSIFINDLEDIVLEGLCAKCQSPVNRYVEAGEVREYRDKIATIKKIIGS